MVDRILDNPLYFFLALLAWGIVTVICLGIAVYFVGFSI